MVTELYACDTMRTMTGDTVRPGGLAITKTALEFCRLAAGSCLLDVGCGTGASVEFLIQEYQLKALGIDPSAAMLALGKKRNPNLPIMYGRAEEIPFPDLSMDAVLAECCMSHFTDIDQALQEFYRVLLPGGWLIISDMYLRPGSPRVGQIILDPATAFMDKETVLKYLNKHGFRLIKWEDHTRELKQLAIDIIMKFGSMTNFWNAAGCSCSNCFMAQHQEVKPGYYLLLARKTS